MTPYLAILIAGVALAFVAGFALGYEQGMRRVLREWNNSLAGKTPTAKREGELR